MLIASAAGNGPISLSFGEYIDCLRTQMSDLITYQGLTNGIDPRVLSVSAGLNHPDPFIVFEASLAASELMNDKSLFH